MRCFSTPLIRIARSPYFRVVHLPIRPPNRAYSSLSHAIEQSHSHAHTSALRNSLLALASLSSWILLDRDRVHAAEGDEVKPIYRSLPPTATAAEHAAVEQLKRSLLATPLPLALVEYVRQWALEDDWTLLRYLRAHKLHIPGAQAGLLATAQWRLTEGIDAIRVDEFKHIYEQGLMYVSTSTDPAGRAVIINRKSPNPSVGWNEAIHRTELRSLVYTMERAIREMEDRLARGEADPSEMDAKWVFLVDMQHYTKSSATPWHVTKSLVDLMRLHYPERLHLAIIVDAPWILRSLLKLLRPVIPKVTREKVLFVNDRHSAVTRQLLTNAVGGVERLPIETGIPGAITKFDYARYIAEDPLAHERPKETRRNYELVRHSSVVASVPSKSMLQRLQFWK